MMNSLIATFFTKFQALQNKYIQHSNLMLFRQNPDSKIHKSFRLGINNYLDISKKAEFLIDEDVTINESNYITVKQGAQLIIGKNTYITRATISCLEKVEIGENCILGEGMKIFDHNHQYTKEPFSVSKTQFNTAPIKIGNNVWTGANCIILKGVTIGHNVILGAGCVVYKDVPDNTLLVNKQEFIFKDL